jgi:hypothetical protein
MYEKAKAFFWTAEEINSRLKWTLNNEAALYLSHPGLLAASDCIVNENLDSNFDTNVRSPEA